MTTATRVKGSHPYIVNDTKTEDRQENRKPVSETGFPVPPCHRTDTIKTADRLPFEQQPRESSKAFAAFKTYLELGPERSLEAVAQRLHKSKTMLGKWSRRHNWQGRIQAHAEHLATIEREAIEALATEKSIEWGRILESIRIAEWQRHKKILALADEMIKRWHENPKKYGTLDGIARLLDLATKLARMAAGMPTEIKEVNTNVTGSIDVDWEIALRKAYGPKTGEVVDVESVKLAEGGQR